MKNNKIEIDFVQVKFLELHNKIDAIIERRVDMSKNNREQRQQIFFEEILSLRNELFKLSYNEDYLLNGGKK